MIYPDIEDMLLVGESCGLNTLQEAHDNYFNHYTMFFYIEDFANQRDKFIRDLEAHHLVTIDEPTKTYEVKPLTIEEALKVYRKYEYVKNRDN